MSFAVLPRKKDPRAAALPTIFLSYSASKKENCSMSFCLLLGNTVLFAIIVLWFSMIIDQRDVKYCLHCSRSNKVLFGLA